jgi:hypothetical protein
LPRPKTTFGTSCWNRLKLVVQQCALQAMHRRESSEPRGPFIHGLCGSTAHALLSGRTAGRDESASGTKLG